MKKGYKTDTKTKEKKEYHINLHEEAVPIMALQNTECILCVRVRLNGFYNRVKWFVVLIFATVYMQF